MMTMHRLGAGDGYTYLTGQVAKGDGAGRGQSQSDYYRATGNPPGRWLGTGAEVLGVEGFVSTGQMHNLYGLGLHPDTGVQLGRRYALYRTVAERVRDRVEDAEKALGHELRPDARAVIEREEIAKGERQAVAGWDCVFSPVKSVSLAWALTEDPAVAREVEAAHHAAVASTLAWMERDVAFARAGAAGVAQVDVAGIAVAAFDHRSSRAGDPDLHTHAVISNKVLARLPDGGSRWLTLDSAGMYRAAVAASERYNSTIEDELTRRLGWTFEVRADQEPGATSVIRELAGMPLEAVKGFSARRAQVEAHYARLLADYHRQHGHTPPRAAQFALAQQATLAGRPAKETGETVGEERARWREQAAAMLTGPQRAQLAEAVAPKEVTWRRVADDVTDEQVEELARRALDDVTGRRSTWTVRHVQAAAQRATRGWQMASPEARDQLVTRVVATVIEPRDGVSDVVRLDPPEIVEAPPQLRRAAGESVFTAHASERFTTARQLDAEDRLLAHAARTDAPRIDPRDVALVDNAGRQRLAVDQLDAVARLATSGRGVGLLIGPAGTGKTTTLKALVRAWQAGTGRRVHGLAPTAVAAAVLKSETGMTDTETIHKWQDTRDRTGEVLFAPGDLVVVDEAGMVGTGRLLDLIDEAEAASAKVVLVGDYRQLSAIESGGALRLLATDAPDVVSELTSVWRFADRQADGTVVPRVWEADASLRLRNGDPLGLDPYFEHQRVVPGAEAILADRLYESWREEQTAGLTAVMIASSNETVAELGRRARADLVAAGRVEDDGVVLADGNLAGVGDVVVTRKNNRLLRAGREFVRNGDLWHVENRHRDGSLDVRHVDHGGAVTLPSDYVAERVEQGYAMTVHRAQGSTVDTAHVLVDKTYSRELFYVAMTRGRMGNTAHVVTDHVLDPDIERPPDPDRLARAVLTDVLRRESGDVSATETLREAQDEAGSLRTLLPRYRYAAELAAGTAARDLVRQGMAADLSERVMKSAGWPALADRVTLLAERGVDADRLLAATIEERGLGGAADPAAVLHARLTPAVIASRPEAGDWLPQAPSGDGELPAYLRAVREAMDTRVRGLGAAAAFERPEWTAALPAVPGLDDDRRDRWELLAGRVAAYREAYEVDGPDPLGPLPAEPRQAEARVHLATAVDAAVAADDVDRAADADTVQARLVVARERLRTAESDYWAAEKAAGDPAQGVREGLRVESAQRLITRLDEAERVEAVAARRIALHAQTAGELARAQSEAAAARGRARRAAERRAAELAEQLAADEARRNAAIDAQADAQVALPEPGARAAARADAQRTLRDAGEVLVRVEAERQARAAAEAERRAEASAALARARAQVDALEQRARAMGLRVEAATAPALPGDDDGRRPSGRGDDGREVGG